MDKSNLEERRENNQIIGSYLEIEDITLEDYGEYKCEVSNGVDEEITLPAHVYRQGNRLEILNRVHQTREIKRTFAFAEPQFALGLQNGSWRRSFLVGVLVLVLLISAGAFYARCWLPLVLLCRDKFAPLEENDGKECDALVCYHEKDSSLVIGIMIPTLESRHRYKCTALELSQLNQNWGAEIGPHAVSSRRVIVILSPASLGNVWNETSVGTVLNQLSSLTVPTIVIATKDLSNTSTIAKRSNRGCNDSSEFSLDRLKILRWDENYGISGYGSQKFWYKLRLAMPPVRPISAESGCQSVAMIVQANGKCGQQKARSRESLEVLV
ncbi:hypothetical protein E2986_12949 [Frieseomelitta varia]|uniref:TIR domain-containing protein n=1 Tax=Frieseomelitta varia TaxID=561572 RepID=A0A833VVG5_9HYME|nr:hypothetical protein E2986_12949 [Frieseomelitta varia]